MATTVTRDDFSKLSGITPKLIRFFEDLFSTAAVTSDAVAGQVEATGSIQSATVLTLSSNSAFSNERVLTLSDDFQVTDNGAGQTLQVELTSPISTNGFPLAFNLIGQTNLDLPTSGQVVALEGGPYADDAAAAAGGVPVNYAYRKTGGALAWRQV